MSISIKPFGKTPSGENAELYILKNKSGASVSITNFGGILNAISVPDREGNLGDVLLGYSSVEGYTPLNGYIGALIGRVGNRIANGECTLNRNAAAPCQKRSGQNASARRRRGL